MTTDSSPRSEDSSSLVKAETRRLSVASGSDGCWVCEDKPTQMCHVLAKEDRLLRDLFQSRGMLNFACNTIENAVVLCSQCHIKFDMMQDPGWTFFPSDLNYFIDYEANDYRRRVLAASNGVRESRLCPTATDYVTTQYQSGSVSPTAPGGLYRRVFLQKLHPHIPLDAIAAEKPWFGAPMAALRRAIHATGSFRTTAFRPDDLSKLRTLQSLYARPGPELAPLLLSAGSQLAAPTTDPQNDGPPSKKRRLPPDNKAEEESREILTDQTGEPHQTMAVSDWILGPQMSTEEIVSRYAHVF